MNPEKLNIPFSESCKMVWNDDEKITFIESTGEKFILNGLDTSNSESINKLCNLLESLSIEQLINFFENDPF